jgi:hypothetical protein
MMRHTEAEAGVTTRSTSSQRIYRYPSSTAKKASAPLPSSPSTSHQQLRKSNHTIGTFFHHTKIKMRSTFFVTAFALVAAVVATPTPQRASNPPPGTPVAPGVRVPKGTFCTTTNDPDVIGCNTGDGGTFNVINGKISGCAGCTPENGFGK